MTKEEFVAQVDRAAAAMPDLPVSTALLRHLSQELKKGDPPWWKETLKAWSGRKFVAWSEAWTLFLAAVHYEALSDAESPLVRYFPSCGGTAEADPSGAFARFLGDLPRTFFLNLKERHVRAYFKFRAPFWMTPAFLAFETRRLPFYLVEINAGAGLNLAADKLIAEPKLSPEAVAARIGLDASPLLLADINDKRWLTAGLLPDDMQGISELDQAIERTDALCRKEATFIQLAECPELKAPRFIAKNIPTDDPDVGLLVFNMGATARMSDADYERFCADMFAMMRPWGDRALWAEVETVRGESFSTTLQLRAHKLDDGAPATHVVAAYDLVARQSHYDPERAKAALLPASARQALKDAKAK